MNQMADEPAAPATPTEPVTPAASAPSATPPTVLGAAEPPKAGDPPADPKVEPPKEPAKADALAAIDPAALKLPEGFKADEAALKFAADILSNDKLSPQERMQSLVDFHAAELKKASEASSKYWGDLQTEWQAKAKEVYGPEPAKSPKIIAVAKLIDSLGEKPASELREALEMSGMGNHPAVIAAFVNLADRLGEPKHLQGNPPAAQAQTPAQAFFPNMKQG
jgi:hypothetical protein